MKHLIYITKDPDITVFNEFKFVYCLICFPTAILKNHETFGIITILLFFDFWTKRIVFWSTLNLFLTDCQWRSMKRLVEIEGKYVSHHSGDIIEKCKMICDSMANKTCQSFFYPPEFERGRCYLFNKKLTRHEMISSKKDCY